MRYWLVKQEPEDYSWEKFVQDRRTAWTGIRSFPARKHLREMAKGDRVLFYHSGADKQVVGIAQVENSAYPDPTATEGEWSSVDLSPVKAIQVPVTLGTIKADKVLCRIPLVRQSRLSVSPLTKEEFDRVLELGKTSPV